MGRSRGGLTSKIHALVDTNGLPVRLGLTAGEAHDNRLAGKLLSRLKSKTMLLADRDYDAGLDQEPCGREKVYGPTSRHDATAPSLSASARISTALGTWSSGFLNKIKHCRRVATRYDKLAANYLAFVQLASIRLWLRVNESASFCNGPDGVKPPEYVAPPSSCFCPWSTPGRHIKLSEGTVSLSRYAWFVR